jgi:hypothetical protein
MGMDASGVPQLKTPAARPPKVSKDGSFPAAHVSSVEKQVGRCGARVEVEVVRVQAEVRGRLEATEKATGPTFAPIEGAAGVVSAAVMENVGRVSRIAGDIGSCGGVRVGCGPKLGTGGAGGVPVALQPERAHGLPCERMRYT